MIDLKNKNFLKLLDFTPNEITYFASTFERFKKSKIQGK